MVIAKRIVHHPVFFKDQYGISHLLYEIPVMRYKEHGAGICLKCRFECLLRRNIHVIGRLIEYHKVRTACQKLCEHKPGLLTA